MKRLMWIVFAALGIGSGCSQPDVSSPSQFTIDCVDAIKKAEPGLKIQLVRDLELKITSSEGREAQVFLDNAYGTFKMNPQAKSEVIQKVVITSTASIAKEPDKIDTTMIVPVIKDRPWLAETRQALLDRGAKETPEHVYDDFSQELVILYALDSLHNIRYLTPHDLQEAKIDRKELRALAVKNLKRLLPKIEREGGNGIYMMTAGGDYEASLLLFDSIWNSGQIAVDGEIVVAIPTRDLLLVTGSHSTIGLGKMRQMVDEASKEGPYRLTKKLFVYRNGKFEEF